MKRSGFFALILMFFPVFCAQASTDGVPAWWEEVEAHSSLPLDSMQKVLSRAYETIVKKSLKDVSAENLATASVKSLSDIDGKIAVHPDGKRIILTADGKILKSWAKLPENDSQNWARLALAAFALVRPYSQKAKAANDEEILNVYINASLGLIDKYSRYESPEKAPEKKLNKPASIGIRYRRSGRHPEITDILPDSPAAQSILVAGDRILRIDARDTDDLSASEILNMLRGEEGTDVSLLVRKDGKSEMITLKRASMPAGLTDSHFDEATRVMTVKIPAFTEQTVSSLSSVLTEATAKQAKGLIIDLRANMGGLLREAVLCADLFLPENTPMLKTKGRTQQAFQAFGASQKDHIPSLPLVILVDAKTASSAEFFAAVLQESKRAVLVGTPTYGKAKIQTAETLPNKGEIFLSWAQYYLPSGYTPDSFGLFPNVCTADKTQQAAVSNTQGIEALSKWKTPANKKKQEKKDLCPAQNRSGNETDNKKALDLILNAQAYEKALNDFSLDSGGK